MSAMYKESHQSTEELLVLEDQKILDYKAKVKGKPAPEHGEMPSSFENRNTQKSSKELSNPTITELNETLRAYTEMHREFLEYGFTNWLAQ